MEAAQSSAKGVVIRRALDLMKALNLGITVRLEEVRADEFEAMNLIRDERDLLDREKDQPRG